MSEVCMPKKKYLCKNGCTVQIIGFQKESDDAHVGRKGIITNPDGSDGGVGYWTSYGLFKNNQKRNYDLVDEMHTGIYVESLHYAGLDIFESNENPSNNDIDELIEAKAKELIAEIVEVSQDCYEVFKLMTTTSVNQRMGLVL